MPPRAEGADAAAEALVVDGPRVDGEQPHQQDQVPAPKHHPEDLERVTKWSKGLRKNYAIREEYKLNDLCI